MFCKNFAPLIITLPLYYSPSQINNLFFLFLFFKLVRLQVGGVGVLTLSQINNLFFFFLFFKPVRLEVGRCRCVDCPMIRPWYDFCRLSSTPFTWILFFYFFFRIHLYMDYESWKLIQWGLITKRRIWQQHVKLIGLIFDIDFTHTIMGVHESVQVGFIHNPKLSRLNWMWNF